MSQYKFLKRRPVTRAHERKTKRFVNVVVNALDVTIGRIVLWKRVYGERMPFMGSSSSCEKNLPTALIVGLHTSVGSNG